jgi:lysophospholipase L1-like esterase
LANELKYRLNHEFETQGVIKPGSTLGKLVNISSSDLKTLTKRDICVVWEGSNDVRRNETIMGIRALKDFVSSHKHTNVIVLNVPHRNDLAPNSCVNHEVQVFNRMLGKLRKVHLNISVVTVDSDRDLYARHGFHLNAQGKEHSADRVAAVVRDLFSEKKDNTYGLKMERKGGYP